MTRAYYNEFDPAAALWLRNNIAAGLIAPGEVDTRSIKEVSPDDLKRFTQHHFFAGIGGWSHAARLAGWPDDRPLWSASCPCQPFSAAGKQAGADDPRHLWPDVHRLASAARPAAIVGEQVAGSLGYGWFDGVRSDLEGEGYACRSVDIPALAIDAPHERNRIYWVAVADAESSGSGAGLCESGSVVNRAEPANGDGGGAMADPQGERGGGDEPERGPEGRAADRGIDAGREASTLADGVTQGDAIGKGLEGQRGNVPPPRRRKRSIGPAPAPDGRDRASLMRGRNGSWWSGADWIVCHDGKARRVADARASLLVDGVRGGVPILRPDSIRIEGGEGFGETRWISRIAAWKGFGNAIVPPLAAEVLAALAEYLEEMR